MKILATIGRILTGIIFTFSGFVKAVDPLGYTYKFIDYFNDAFFIHSIDGIGFPFAIFMSALELGIGIMLIFNLKPKLAIWGALLLMAFFTPLTLYLAIANPVQDCGCFGDAIIMTNWQTFWKNIVILIFVLLYFVYRKKFKEKLKSSIQYLIILSVFVLSIGFQFYNYAFLPIIDFRPYKVGTYIPEKMTVPEDAPKDVYKSSVIYKNKDTDEIKEYPADDYPWDDSVWVATWEWQESKSVLISKGYEAPIHDFNITTNDGMDITEDILNEEKPVLLIIAYDIEKSNKKALSKFAEQAKAFEKNKGGKIYCLTSSSDDIIAKELELSILSAPIEFCFSDQITLKTIVRANPGLVLMQKGTIVNKWHYNNNYEKGLLEF